MAACHRPGSGRAGVVGLSRAAPDLIGGYLAELCTGLRVPPVVALVAHGLSNDEIAGVLVLSPATAKTHVSRAMIKLGARDRAQLVVFAYQTGMVAPRAGQAPGH